MTRGPLKPVLSLTDCVGLTVGLVIGAGIFRLPSAVAAAVPDAGLILLLWLLGGAISLIGALCYAELATAYPSAGGEYHFLTRAYGRNVGFLFAWARITVIQSGSIALFAFVFGDYATALIPLGTHSASIYALAVIIVLTGVNLMGIRGTTTVQKVLFVATVIGLCAIAATAVLPGAPPPPAAPEHTLTAAGFGSAMLLVLLTFGGWNEAAYLSAEVRDPKRNIVRALLISIAVITVLYLGVNFAYLNVLGVTAVAASQTVASDVMQVFLGDWGAFVVTLIVLLVVLDNTNITLFTGARSAYALGGDFPLFRFLDRWDTARGVPVTGVLVQGGIALAIALAGAYTRRGVETVVDFLQPVFWTFFLLTGIALFVLRRRDPDAARPFRVPLYPLTPALFCLVGAYMLHASVMFTGKGAMVGIAVLLSGLPVLWLARRSLPAHPASTSAPADTTTS